MPFELLALGLFRHEYRKGTLRSPPAMSARERLRDLLGRVRRILLLLLLFLHVLSCTTTGGLESIDQF